MTALDEAFALMERDPADDTARLRFFERLAGSELFLLLETEPDGADVQPMVFPVEETRFVLAFDREERLAEFAKSSAPYVAVSGRALSAMLSGQSLGLGLNLDVAPSSYLIPAEAIDWLNNTLAQEPEETSGTPQAVLPPTGLPEALITALDGKLATAHGLASFACLAELKYRDGGSGHILVFIDAVPGAEPALTRAANEALIFSGIEAGQMDVAFLSGGDPTAQRIMNVGLRFEIPALPERPSSPKAPGRDPEKPPRLR